MNANGGERLTEELLSWAGVTIHPHRFGGVEFQYSHKEIGHLHGVFLFDLSVTKSEHDRWIEEGKASVHHMYPHSNWLSVYLNTGLDVDHAIEIARSKYDQMILRRV
ncbi:luciferase family protein [Paenibacillus fonticola]|uniref:luciferase domain-containing protein n=1 Tax=Paenibacillus fonticola TaxID=379896 RepID=UPI0003687957|nr:luciferase family protein [Paenibacillus fonticola]